MQASFNHAFQNFDWNGMMHSLEVAEGHPIKPIRNATSVQDQVVALMGHTYRVCPAAEQLALLWSLAGIFSPAVPERASCGSGGPSTMETSVSSCPNQLYSGPNRNTKHAVELFQYTCMLSQMAQKENKAFQRTKEDTITLVPPLFRVTVQYGDISCCGSARTKKEAAHLAAKGIYSQLFANE